MFLNYSFVFNFNGVQFARGEHFLEFRKVVGKGYYKMIYWANPKNSGGNRRDDDPNRWMVLSLNLMELLPVFHLMRAVKCLMDR